MTGYRWAMGRSWTLRASYRQVMGGLQAGYEQVMTLWVGYGQVMGRSWTLGPGYGQVMDL